MLASIILRISSSMERPINLPILLLILLSHFQSTISSEFWWPKNIFILAGQSNMAGRGGVKNSKWDGIVPPECKSSSGISRLTADPMGWEMNAAEPLHKDIDVNRTCGVGPGLVFANTILDKFTLDIGMIGLVPCAIGGTNISEWSRGSALYLRMLERAQAALENGGIIRGFLWYQGESDTVTYEDAESYQRRLVNFFTDLRSDFETPTLPIIQVALTSGEGPYVEKIRQVQLGINLTNVKTVDAKGLPLEADNLHLTTAAQVSLGKMMAEAFIVIAPPIPLSDWSCAPERFNNFLFNFLFRWFR